MKADYTLGVSLLQREDESLFDYMMSFSPFAPFFGVPYRFAGALRTAPWPLPTAAADARESRVQPGAEDAQVVAEASAPEADLPVAEKAEPPAPAEPAAAEAAPQAEATLFDREEPAGAEESRPERLYDAAPENADDLTQIKGVGPKLAAELNGMGIYTFDQMASMTEANLAWIDSNLTAFRGRSVRDDWVGQAATLRDA